MKSNREKIVSQIWFLFEKCTVRLKKVNYFDISMNFFLAHCEYFGTTFLEAFKTFYHDLIHGGLFLKVQPGERQWAKFYINYKNVQCVRGKCYLFDIFTMSMLTFSCVWFIFYFYSWLTVNILKLLLEVFNVIWS